jgi:hypothetical protein
MRRGLLAVCLGLLPDPVGAAGFEVALQVGGTLPFYEQSFQYQPPPPPFAIPGVSIEQEGGFEVQARGGLAIAGSLALVVKGPLAVEARWDHGTAYAEVVGARYRVDVRLPSPMPPLTSKLELGSGESQITGLSPMSLNLQLRFGSPRFRFVTSGGVSHLASLGLEIRPQVAIGLTGLTPFGVDIGTLAIEAKDSSGGGFWGANLGMGVHVGLGARLALVGEARVFGFGTRELTWQAASPGPQSSVEAALLDALLRELDPVKAQPGFYQVAGGLVLRF